MGKSRFKTIIADICKKDKRFHQDAYLFVRQALDYTVRWIREQKPKRKTLHVSGQELLDGIRQFALKQYGPLTLMVLHYWGIRKCEDFGDIVFHLVKHKVLDQTKEDKKEDFSGGYNFEEAFLSPFLPS